MAQVSIIQKKLLLLTALIFCPTSAQSAAITNLSDKTHVIEIRTLEGYRKEEIPAQMTYRTPGAIDIRYEQKDYRIDAHEEYAIWPSSELQPQKTRNRPSH